MGREEALILKRGLAALQRVREDMLASGIPPSLYHLELENEAEARVNALISWNLGGRHEAL